MVIRSVSSDFLKKSDCKLRPNINFICKNLFRTFSRVAWATMKTPCNTQKWIYRLFETIHFIL